MERDAKLSTNTVTPELIDYIVQKIVAHVGPRLVIVFGSHASGQASPAGDLDLLVVQDNGKSNREIRRIIDRLLFGRRFGVDIIVRQPEEVQANLQDRNPFYVVTTQPTCHCERSEAISEPLGDCFVANGAPRNDSLSSYGAPSN